MRFFMPVLLIFCNWSIICLADATADAKRFENPQPEDYSVLLQSPYFARYPLTMWQGLETLWEQDPAVVMNLLFQPASMPGTEQRHTLFSLPLKGLDTQSREALANTYLFFIKHLSHTSALAITQKAFFRLYRDLADTPAGREVLTLPQASRFMQELTFDDVLVHARTLDGFNQNTALIATLEPWLRKETAPLTFRCEASYLAAKAYRQERRYEMANHLLSVAAHFCEGQQLRQVRYLQARLAGIAGMESSLETFNAYLAAYPTHPSSADVLLWKIRLEDKWGHHDEANAAREKLFSQFPQNLASMEARFLNAIQAAKGTNPAAGLAALAEIAHHKNLPALQRQRAAYWHARLQVFPQDPLVVTKNPLSLQEGKQELHTIAKEHPTRYYGVMARLLLQQLQDPEFIPAFAPVPFTQQQAFSINILPEFGVVEQLIQTQHTKAAVALADMLLPEQKTRSGQMALVELYRAAGRPEKAYRIMWQLGLTDVDGPLTAEKMQRWTTVYPRPFPQAIANAAAATNLDENLFYGLIREESALNPNTISQAGAVGLSQLMPTTAQQEAQALGITIAPSQLKNVDINTQLGAQHLARHLNTFAHPILALAAYNGGPEAVSRWLAGAPADQPLDVFIENIPYKETREYVKRIISAWAAYSILQPQPTVLDIDLQLPRPVLQQ